MKKFLMWTVCASAALCTVIAQAGLPPVGTPPSDKLGNGVGSVAAAPIGGRVIADDFFDGFESYPLGEFCEGGGWAEWDGSNGVCGTIVDDPAIDTQSLEITANDDMVQQFNRVSGIHELTTWVFVPTGATGRAFVIMLNTYPSPFNWSLDLSFDATAGKLILFDDPTFQRELIKGSWVKTVVRVDLDEDLMQIFYDDEQFIFDRSWKEGASGGGEARIQALDLFADTSSATYYDNVSMVQLPDPIGACCDPESSDCVDDISRPDCPGRFSADTLCADLDPPCGQLPDECVRAMEMGADDVVLFSNREATWTFDDFPMCFNGGDQAVRTMWFKFTATSNFTRVRTCGTPVEGGAPDTLVSVFPTGADDECLFFEPDIGCSDDACGAPSGLHAEVCVETTPGEVYDIMVGAKPGTRGGIVSLETSSHDQCPPPTVGACCTTNQRDGSESCFDQSSGDCFGLGGFYSGDDTRCADDNCPDCNPACPEGQTPEGGFCGFDGGLDNNSGCNGDGNPEDFTNVELDEVVCGLSSSDGGARDTDWMSIELEAGTTYEFVVDAGFSALTGFAGYNEGFEGSGDCADTDGFINPGGNQAPGESIVEFTPVATGTYFPFVAPANIGGQFVFVPCCSGTNGWTGVVRVAAGGGCVRNPAWQCDGDTDGDGQVNPVDVGVVQAAFGSGDEQDLCNYDMDCDGQINPVDVGIVQSLFGTCNPVRDVCP